MRPVPIASAVFALAAVTALAAPGCDKKSDAAPTPVPVSAMPVAAPGQLRVTADNHGFTPSSLTVPASSSHVTVQFIRTTDETCATEVVFPDLHIKQDLPLNQVVGVELPGGAGRTLHFQCGMGMFKGEIVVK
jgi:hypothetical protein